MSSYVLHLLIMALFFVYLASAWNLVGGLAGQHSLGHSLFVGTGSYVSTLLFIHLGLSPWFGLLVGATAAALLALFVGYLSFRYELKGPFFLLVTLAFAEVARIIVTNLDITRGSSGLFVPLKGNAPLLFQFEDRSVYLLVIGIMAVGAIVLTYAIRRSWFGYSLLAIRENEAAARACGIYAERCKLAILTISGILCAIGGTFYAQYTLFIEPISQFGIALSVEMILFCIVGGIGTVFGPAIGAVALFGLGELTRNLLAFTTIGNLHLIVYASVLLFVVIFLPDGIVGAYNRRMASRRRVRSPDPAPGANARQPVALPPSATPPSAQRPAPTGDEPLLVVKGISKRFGGVAAVTEASFAVPVGSCVGIIGPNGSGKSTTLNMIAGALNPDAGSVLLRGASVAGRPAEAMCKLGVARTFQIPQAFGDLTARENVMVGAFAVTGDAAEASIIAERLLTEIGLAHTIDMPVRALTAAERKKIEIARALATKPTILLLDEALAGLTEQECDEMIAFLRARRSEGLTLVLVEHIMRVVTALCDHVVFLNFGKVVAQGTSKEVLEHPDVVRAYLGSD